jgi:hypothetical protein
MFGAMTSATAQFVVANADDGNVSTTNAGRVARFGTECICLLSNGTPTIDALAKFVSFNADGFSDRLDGPARLVRPHRQLPRR